jgi:hypothetical protein
VRISFSKYKKFLDNQEHFRLFYMLGLTPEGEETPTLFNFGRRRGRCFHELSEARAGGNYEAARRALLKEHGRDMVERCEAMAEVVPDLGPLDWVERSFDIPIGDGKHSIIGRIDHRFINRDGVRQLGDFKTTKGTRTKAQLTDYFRDLESSLQHHFYLRAELEFSEAHTGLFTYHVVFDRKDKDHKPTYVPLEVPYLGPAAVNRSMAAIYAACEEIEFLTQYGIEKPWPDSHRWFFGSEVYAEIAGRTIPKGAIPQGFTTRWKEQIQAEGEAQ